ncbi:Nitrate transporter [Sparassis crispa]|uniref:Nitrate/nitrite transporter n=1 Tax=Sparassis crispa TaxID=139825 RepID=A0A401G9D0_9APHY|nr:Nitrate transporter [Sparassis crispa]GBE78767.1 Nitrate transporter [Sparassis crispa]
MSMSSTTLESEFTLWQSLTQAHLNPLNKKCVTLPILNLRNQYSRNFHLSWLGFWVAFLSWFAFSPLIPVAVKKDLNLTAAQIGNSNVVSLCSTLVVRIIVGPLVDRYGPRKVMAGLLVIGAIPSGLAGTIATAQGLYIVRFFIGILGGTFVPCQAWTTAFFDKCVVGRANALAGGWGNAGGGFTFIIMVALYDRLIADRLASHVAWRVAFAIVPVPVLLFTAAAVLAFGTDHPNGRWSDRHGPTPSEPDVTETEQVQTEHHKNAFYLRDNEKKSERVNVQVDPAEDGLASLDTAVNEPLTWSLSYQLLVSSLTWLPSLAYLTSFGFELAMDANLSNVLYDLYSSRSFGQTKSGYIASIYGLLNVWTRPFGGYLGDVIYRRFGVPGKKYLMLVLGILQGFMSIALGLYIDSRERPSLAVVIVVFTILAIVNEAGNGANFSLVPHCNPNSNGMMSGVVGAMGNLGGVLFALVFRFQPIPYGKAFWIVGIVTVGVNAVLLPVRVPRW